MMEQGIDLSDVIVVDPKSGFPKIVKLLADDEHPEEKIYRLVKTRAGKLILN